jgi:hypothetical protein
VVQPTMNECRSYVDDLARAQVQAGLQQALEAERDEIVGRSWHQHHRMVHRYSTAMGMRGPAR